MDTHHRKDEDMKEKKRKDANAMNEGREINKTKQNKGK
jgi:hypothetical protein